MSDDPFGAALADRAGAGESDSGDPFGDALASVASGNDNITGKKPQKMPDGSRYTGEPWQDALLKGRNPGGQDTPVGVVAGKLITGAAGLGAKVASGYRGLYDLATGNGLDRASSDIAAAQATVPSYQDNPNATGATALAQEAMSFPTNPVNWPAQVGKGVTYGLNKAEAAPEVASGVGQAVAEVGPLALGLGRGAPKDTMAAEPEVPGPSTAPVSTPAEAQAALNQRAAQSSGSMGAAAAAHDISKASPELQEAVAKAVNAGPINHEALGRQLEADSLGMKLTPGQATGDPDLISSEMNNRGAHGTAQLYKEQNEALVRNVQDLRDKVGEDVYSTNPIEHGDAIIQAYKDKDAPIVADISAKYKALQDANGGDFPVDGQKFVANTKVALKKSLKSDYVPAPIQKALDAFGEGEPMTFEDFEALRTNLAGEIRKAQRSGDGNAAMASSIVRDQLEKLPLTGEAANLKPLADAARSAAKARFDALREDPAYQAAVDGDVPPDQFVQKFITGANKTATRDGVAKMVENLKDNPSAVHTMGVAALDHIREQAMPNGGSNFSQARFNKYVNQLSPKLQSILSPEDAAKMETIGNVARYTQEQPRGSYVNNSNTLTGALAEGAKSAAEGAVNVAAKGVPVGTWIRKAAQNRATQKAAAKTSAVGAGISEPTTLSTLLRPAKGQMKP